MSNGKYQWDNLPKELLEMIGKCLDFRVDVIRFRSVCKSWRSSVPPPSFEQEIRPLVLNLPHPISQPALFFQTTICRLQLRTQKSNSFSKGWLTKVCESKRGKLLVLHPITNQERYFGNLNLQDFQFVPLTKAVTLKTWAGNRIPRINKVVWFSMSTNSTINGLSILAIYQEGKLGYWKLGDDEWTPLADQKFEYDDIIAYKGQFYVVDRWGTVSWIDSSLRVVPYSPPLFGCGVQKNLVESCGELYVVDRYLDRERNDRGDHEGADEPDANKPNAIDFRVYKLDEEWGRWIDVNSLGDRVFVLGVDCSFSVSCQEFHGGNGNCIYFTDGKKDLLFGVRGQGINDGVRVFNLEDRSITRLARVPQSSHIFLPPNIGYRLSEFAEEP